MIVQRLISVFVCGAFLVSCTSPYTGYNQNYKQGVPVVSATRGSGEYISREGENYKEYVSALQAAQKDTGESLDQPAVNPIDEYISNLDKESYPAPEVIQYEALGRHADLSSAWGKPVGSVGEGVTLMDVALRKRFNDALSTTPVGSQAKWDHLQRNYIFMPNSDVYQPYYSGGSCRDGVFVNYVRGQEEKVRGLFCQTGRGADWYLMK